MFIRPVLSRIYKRQQLANFCCIETVKPSIVDLQTPISPSNPNPLYSHENSTEKAFVISYLINSCGLSPDKAISVSAKVHFDSPDKPNAVLGFLEKIGFSKTQITDLIRKRPLFLLSKPEKSLLPKIEFFFYSTGFSKIDTFKILARHPKYLTISVENQLLPIYGFLKDIIGSEKVATLLRRGSWVFFHNCEKRLIRNVDFLRETGVPPSCIEFSLFHFPDAISQEHEQFKEIVAEVKEMGLDPSKTTFIVAVHARSGKSNKALWARCYETYGKWGWSKDDIFVAFRKHPQCMLLSEEKISRALDFLINEMGLESRMIARIPYVIFYSLEKRIIPRCSILRLLASKGLVKRNWSLTSVLCYTEKEFLKTCVTKYEKDLPQLYDIYQEKQGT